MEIQRLKVKVQDAVEIYWADPNSQVADPAWWQATVLHEMKGKDRKYHVKYQDGSLDDLKLDISQHIEYAGKVHLAWRFPIAEKSRPAVTGQSSSVLKQLNAVEQVQGAQIGSISAAGCAAFPLHRMLVLAARYFDAFRYLRKHVESRTPGCRKSGGDIDAPSRTSGFETSVSEQANRPPFIVFPQPFHDFLFHDFPI